MKPWKFWAVAGVLALSLLFSGVNLFRRETPSPLDVTCIVFNAFVLGRMWEQKRSQRWLQCALWVVGIIPTIADGAKDNMPDRAEERETEPVTVDITIRALAKNRNDAKTMTCGCVTASGDCIHDGGR